MFDEDLMADDKIGEFELPDLSFLDTGDYDDWEYCLADNGDDGGEVHVILRANFDKGEEIKTMFSMADADGSGFVDEEEVKELSKKLGQKLSNTQLRTAMERMDPDGDGEVTFPEFEAWWIAFGDEARERPRVPKCELLWSTCGFGMCATACGYGTASHWPATAVPPAAVSLPPHHRHQVPGTGAAARHRRGARRGRAGLAGGETATLLHPPLPFSRCFNMDGKGASAG